MRMLLAVALGTLVGCSSSSSSSNGPGGSCSTGAICGGNPVGMWTITSSCINSTLQWGTSCPVTDQMSIQISGTLTIGSDSTFAESELSTGTQDVTFPTSCLTQSGATCEQNGSSIAPAAGSTPSGPVLMTCVTSGTECHCTKPPTTPATTTPTNTSGTYSVQGSSIAFTSGTSTAWSTDQFSFCVSGNQLTLTAPLLVGDAGTGESVTETGNVVYTRQ